LCRRIFIQPNYIPPGVARFHLRQGLLKIGLCTVHTIEIT